MEKSESVAEWEGDICRQEREISTTTVVAKSTTRVMINAL
jgi:hypothetical protein